MLFLQSWYSKTRYVSDLTRKKDGGCTFCHNTLRTRQRKSHTLLRQCVSLWYWTNFVYARLFEVYRVTWSVLISAFWQLTFVFFPLSLCLNIQSPLFYPAEPWFYRMVQTAFFSTINTHLQLTPTSFMSFHVKRVSVEPWGNNNGYQHDCQVELFYSYWNNDMHQSYSDISRKNQHEIHVKPFCVKPPNTKTIER